MLVTIFGDSVAPAGGEIWLGDLIGLAGPFGFSDRLTRTSVFRLTSEGWFETERVGRRSRYRLTDYGRNEFAQAEQRIYHAARPHWDGEWTLVFTELASIERESAQLLGKHLTWHGFAPLANEVYAAPGDGRAQLGGLLERLGLDTRLPTARARFDDLPGLVESHALSKRFGLEQAAASYRDFLERYGWTEGGGFERISDAEAFLLRTMLIHDLRRARLSDPWLPAELIGAGWPGRAAHALAAAVYGEVDEAAWAWLESEAGLVRPADEQLSRARFV